MAGNMLSAFSYFIFSYFLTHVDGKSILILVPWLTSQEIIWGALDCGFYYPAGYHNI